MQVVRELEALAAVGREQRDAGGVDRERDRRAGRHATLAGQAQLEREVAVAAPDQVVGAHGLDEVDGEAVPAAARAEMLGPDAESDRLPRLRPRGKRVAVERQAASATGEGELDRRRSSVPSTKFMRGLPTKPATKRLAGRW